jgi:hypothetical protein
MKRTVIKNKKALKLERRLALVRTTIRELRPNQLEQVNGGDTEFITTCHLIYTT